MMRMNRVAGLLAVCLTVLSLQSAVAQTGLTPVQLAGIESVGSVYLSEDGKTAAFTKTVPADPFKENGFASYHLYLYDMQSGEVTPFITGMSVSGIAFRPNHNSITFLAKKEGDATRSIYEISLNGGEAQKLYAFDTNISGYEWGSDGNHVVFRAAEPAEKESSPLPYSPEIYEEDVTGTVAYMQNVGMEGHIPHKIPVEGTVYSAHWSPDMSKVALGVAPTPFVDDFYMNQKVVIVDHESREVLAEIDHEGKMGAYHWSPDGKHIAMIAAATLNDPIDGRLKIADASNGETTLLQEDFEGKFDQIAWKDSKTLYYLASKGVYSELGTIKADGSGMKAMVMDKNLNLKAFAEGAGHFVLDANSPSHPDEMFVMKKGAKSPERVTNSNPWLENIAMGKQEVVTYKADDGMELEGLLIYPTDYVEGERYPVITVVHGGPEAHYDNGWLTAYSMAGQVGAAQGFAVFYPNYRGSTGRGLEFAMSSQADLAGKEFDDIVDGVDYLINQGIADENRIGVTGGSYGGYATAWMSTYYSDRFAAGVMFVGISNNISKWGTSDIPEELYHVHSRKRIWKDYQDYLERSPIYYVDRAKTPLLIMHGKNDTRVDPGQSYELYRHIKTRTETPVRLVLYPGEGHGNRRATAQFDYNLRMLRWFNEYLKGDKVQPGTELNIEPMSLDK